jgi:hypothetical protein
MTPKRSIVPAAVRGFVLIEALLALVLLSFVLALFGTALHFGQRVLEAGRARDEVARFATGIDAMSRLLGRAMPVLERTTSGSQPVVLFEGQPNRVAFVTLSQGEVQAGGLLATVIAFEGSSRPNQLGSVALGTLPLRLGERLSLANVAEGTDILVPNVRSVELSYFGSKADGQPAVWHGTWAGASVLPQLVAMRTRLRLNRQDHTIEFTFRLPNG